MANKRYITAISFYTYAENDQDAFNQSQKVCDEMIKENDNQATVESLHSQPFAILELKEIDIQKLK